MLLLGFLLAPVLSALVTGSALFAEFLACAAAGAVAGKRVGDARLVHFQGALAASSAFLLFLPLLLWLPLGRDAERNLYFGITTAAAGACAGFLAGRRRDDEPHAR